MSLPEATPLRVRRGPPAGVAHEQGAPSRVRRAGTESAGDARTPSRCRASPRLRRVVSAAAQRTTGRARSPAAPMAPLPGAAPTGELRVVRPVRRPDRVPGRAEGAPARRIQPAGTVRSILPATLAVTAVVLAALAVVAGHVLVARDQLRLDRLDGEIAVATLRNDQLRLEVAQLSAPGRLAVQARSLGLVVPTSVTYLEPAPLTPPASR